MGDGSTGFFSLIEIHQGRWAGQILSKGGRVAIIWCLRKVLSLCGSTIRLFEISAIKTLFTVGGITDIMASVIFFFCSKEFPGYCRMFSISDSRPSVILATTMSPKCVRITKHINQFSSVSQAWPRWKGHRSFLEEREERETSKHVMSRGWDAKGSLEEHQQLT